MAAGVTANGTTSGNGWQRLITNGYFGNIAFLRIREESTAKHHKENSLNLEEDLEEELLI